MSLISLSPEQRQELHAWLLDQQIPTSQIGKHFADGAEMAKLLKKYYPNWIDLSQYPPRKNTTLKTRNWAMLNTKVLGKLKLFQTKIKLEDFACGTTNAIEILLYKLMRLQKAKRAKQAGPTLDAGAEPEYEQTGDIMTIKLKRNIDGKITERPIKLISFAVYEQLLKDIEVKRESLMVAELVVAQNMKMLKKREDRIQELRAKLESCTAKTLL